MNKTELIQAVAEATELTRAQADAAVNAVTAIIEKALAEGEKVQITGFGTFEARKRAARTGRDMNTGSKIEIAESVAPAFRAGKQLKDAVSKA